MVQLNRVYQIVECIVYVRAYTCGKGRDEFADLIEGSKSHDRDGGMPLLIAF